VDDLEFQDSTGVKPGCSIGLTLSCAYYLEWHMRQALAPILFDDHDRAAGEALRSSPVAKAEPSPAAKRKASKKSARTTDSRFTASEHCSQSSPRSHAIYQSAVWTRRCKRCSLMAPVCHVILSHT
jgi:hypothetical protein